jgi:hypothetical protein
MRLLAALYVAAFVAVGVVMAFVWPDGFLLWIPFGVLLAAFRLGAGTTPLARAVMAYVSAAVVTVSVGTAVASVLALLDERRIASGDPLGVAFYITGGALIAAWLFGGFHLTRALGGARRRHAMNLAALLPTLGAVFAAAVAGLCLALTPPGWLNGIVALLGLVWAALVAAWVLGAWLVVVAARPARGA